MIIMDYKKLLKAVLPEIKYQYGDKTIVYILEYHDVYEYNNFIDIWVTIKRIPDDSKITVRKKLLLINMDSEVRLLSKYVPPLSKIINFKLGMPIKNHEDGLDFI